MRIDMDFADIKPSVLNTLVVTLMAVLGITAGKFLTARYLPNTPLADLFNAV